MERLLKAIYFAGMGAEIVLRLPYDRERRKIPKTDQRVTRTEQGILWLLSVVSFLLPLVFSLTPWLDRANYRWSRRTRARAGGVGAAMLAAAIWVFWRAHRDLGANWSPSLEIGEQHQLVTRGVYGTIRHPMYASLALWSVGQALLLQNWVAGPTGLLAFLSFYYLRVPSEERMMYDHFGAAYQAYCAQTGRIVPPLRRAR